MRKCAETLLNYIPVTARNRNVVHQQEQILYALGGATTGCQLEAVNTSGADDSMNEYDIWDALNIISATCSRQERTSTVSGLGRSYQLRTP